MELPGFLLNALKNLGSPMHAAGRWSSLTAMIGAAVFALGLADISNTETTTLKAGITVCSVSGLPSLSKQTPCSSRFSVFARAHGARSRRARAFRRFFFGAVNDTFTCVETRHQLSALRERRQVLLKLC